MENQEKVIKYKEYMERKKERCKQQILNVINDSTIRFTSKNLQNIVDDLKEIEIILDFIDNDFENII